MGKPISSALTLKQLATPANPSAGETQVYTKSDDRLYTKTSAGIEAVVGLPAGSMTMYAGASAPTGWLLCDGQALDTTAQAALFAIIGYTFGGSGTSFNVPDLRDRFPVGAGAGVKPLGESGGSETITTANMPAHSHTINHDHSTQYNTADGTSPNTIRTATSTGLSTAETNMILAHSGSSGNTGSGTPYTPKYLALNYIIKA